MCDRTGCDKPRNSKHWAINFSNNLRKVTFCDDCWSEWSEIVDKNLYNKKDLKELFQKFLNKFYDWRIA